MNRPYRGQGSSGYGRPGGGAGGARWLIVLLILAALAIGAYLWWARSTPPATKPVAEAAPQVPEAPVLPPPQAVIEHPLPATEPSVPDSPELPPLESSDQAAREALGGALGPRLLADWIVPQEIIRRVVITVDNLPRETLPIQVRLVRPMTGAFLTRGTGEEKTLSTENYARYTPLLRLAEAVNPHALAEIYLRFYPLLQSQYKVLGYPDGYFNDAMVRAVDNLLRTPDIREPIRLVQPKVLYKYEDPTLENLSIGQRMMLRMGPDQVVRAKQVLRGFRQEITGRAPKS